MEKKTNAALEQLPRYQQRQFLPESADLTCKQVTVDFYQQLLDRPVQTADELKALLCDRSELEAAVGQVQSILYIRMTCQTDDPDRAAAYKAFIETIMPAIQPLSDQLDRKIVDAIDTTGFEDSYYDLYFRKMRSDIDIFRADNVPLQTEDALLSQEYQTVTGAMTVEFQDQEQTMPQMQKFLQEPDRMIREQAWRATAQRYLQDREILNDIFDKMVSRRHTIAQNACFANYRDYKFKERYRFDYMPDDCRQYHQAAEACLVPLQDIFYRQRKKDMQIEQLRPWDIAADPFGKAPLKPAANLDDFLMGLLSTFTQVSEDFGDQFQMMIQLGLLDLESRKGKAPGGYQSCLFEARKPFIFGNTTGTNNDLLLMTHEGGHAFHTLACVDEPLLAYRHPPIEFCEVASMSMELLAASRLDVFYNDLEQKRWWRKQLETIVYLLLKVAAYDAFQHWLYENPSHTRTEREQQWVELQTRYGSNYEDWDGLYDERASQWHRVLHVFQFPFYFIEYGIAQLGALGMWLQSKQDRQKAIANYKKALALGGSKPLPELFAAAGLTFDFSEKTVRPLAETLLNEWKKYAGK